MGFGVMGLTAFNLNTFKLIPDYLHIVQIENESNASEMERCETGRRKNKRANGVTSNTCCGCA